MLFAMLVGCSICSATFSQVMSLEELADHQSTTSKIHKLKGNKNSCWLPACCFLNSLVTIQNPFEKLKVVKTNRKGQDCNTYMYSIKVTKLFGITNVPLS